jgi:hypothetical protein
MQFHEAEANAAAQSARQAIASDLKVGSSESEIRTFFQRHGWRCGFEEEEYRFHCKVFRSPEGTRTDLDIYVDAVKTFVRSDVQVNYTYY